MKRIVHCGKDFYDVYCGRPSQWGNPFLIGKDGTREEVIEKFEDFIRNNQYLLSRLHELKGKILGCWCAPKKCHCEVLLKLLKETGIEQ